MNVVLETPWGHQTKKPMWFLLMAIIAFPVSILLAASFQPLSFRDKESVYRLFSVNVLYLHLFTFLLVSVLILRGCGRIRFGELGLKIGHVPKAIAAVIVSWSIAQMFIILALSAGFAEGTPKPEDPSLATTLSRFVANSFGTGLNEETYFRGFLLVQLYCWFAKNPDGRKLGLKAFLLAALLSSMLFALLHFRTTFEDLSQLMIGGLVGAFLYARTRNLFVNIGLHGLFNAPMPVLSCGDDIAKLAVLAGMLVLALLWPYFSVERINSPSLSGE